MTQTPLKVVFWGTYDLSKPRTRILRDGLVEAGVNVIEVHTDIWSRFADKSQLGKAAMVLTLLRVMLAYPSLLWRYLRAPEHDVVVVPYMGQFDVLVIGLVARLRGKPVVWDMFLSLYDTVVHDRQMVSKRSPIAWLLRVLEWLSCRSATRVLLDTNAHAAYMAELFSLSPEKVAAVPVGAETGVFVRQPPKPQSDEPTQVIFYGQLIPLHGIETILDAALSKRGQAHHWHIIGKGQLSDVVSRRLHAGVTRHIRHDDWVAYEALVTTIGKADLCLGIFGSSRKAGNVVPNKVYQCLAAGRTVITRQSPAMAEVFPNAADGLIVVPPADPDALLDAIDAARAADFPVMPAGALKVAQPAEIGTQFRDLMLGLLVSAPEMPD